MLISLLLAMALLLSTASQLRPAPDLPLGPGEILLVAWLICMLGRETVRGGPPFSPPLVRLLLFWGVFAFAQGLGAMIGLATVHGIDLGSASHDTLAYILMFGVSCLCVAEPGARERLRETAWLLVLLGATALLLLMADAWNWVRVPMIQPWYYDRLRGWSENPNQLALSCMVLAILAFHLMETAEQLASRLLAGAAGSVAVYAGVLTKSDSFNLVVWLTIVILLALKLGAWLRPPPRDVTLRQAFAWQLVLILPISLLAIALLYGDSTARGIGEQFFKGPDDQGSLRLQLWQQALDKGIDSWLLGLGPGGHLERPFPMSPEQANFEAHNTMLDLFTQGGLLAVGSVLCLLAFSVLGAFQTRAYALVALLCGLALFASFHLIVRQPMFWFAIAAASVAGRTAPAGHAAHPRS
ncbi:O-antigen ligase family protein [Geminicoccus roseus]|uniref:O-antigen ligase family protein n=1 Tax=Geminicoccus roseus TaxID=404900 RepID=UPI00041F4C41|nr:O-antigen ligase family protein [Geminicoccus roseus]